MYDFSLSLYLTIDPDSLSGVPAPTRNHFVYAFVLFSYSSLQAFFRQNNSGVSVLWGSSRYIPDTVMPPTAFLISCRPWPQDHDWCPPEVPSPSRLCSLLIHNHLISYYFLSKVSLIGLIVEWNRVINRGGKYSVWAGINISHYKTHTHTHTHTH